MKILYNYEDTQAVVKQAEGSEYYVIRSQVSEPIEVLDTYKKCLCCKREYPGSEQSWQCKCGKRLYMTSSYYAKIK